MSLEPHKPRRMVHKVRQACEACRNRKIRCDNFSPCQNCQRIGAPCTYLTPKKKGPKKKEKKESMSRPNYEQKSTDEGDRYSQASSVSSVSSLSKSGFKASPLLSVKMIQNCLDLFFLHKYPLIPILNQEEMYNSLQNLDDSPVQYSLLISVCAMVTLQTELFKPAQGEESKTQGKRSDFTPSADFLVNEACRARTYCNQIDNPALESVQTSYFLFMCLSRLGKDNAAWFHLREAMTMLQLLRFHEEATYTSISDAMHSQNCRRTFWLLFNAERSYALQHHRPLTLRRSITLPTILEGFEESEGNMIAGFLDSIALFRNFGNGFLSLWNTSDSSVTSSQPLVQLQEFLQSSIPNVSERSEIQQAHLLVNRQWLKMLVWQLCLSKSLLSSNAASDDMSFHFPVEIAREVILVSRLLPVEAFQSNGIEILEKIFDIGSTLADVLLVHPNLLQTSAFEVGPKDYLMELIRILGMEIEGNSRYLRVLATRADECLGVRLPRELPSPSDVDAGDIHWQHGIDDNEEVYDSPFSSLA